LQASQFRDFETIVVDDGSTDHTNEIAAKFKNVKIISQKNSGPAVARNTGAKAARGKYLQFFDADVVVLPDTLSIGIEAMKSKNADAVNGIYSKEPANNIFAAHYKALLEYYTFHKGSHETYAIIIASNALIKKDVFDSLGGFNTTEQWARDTKIGLENDEFGYRLSKKYKNIVEPRMQVKHNFPNFSKLTKIYFYRTFSWIKLFLHKKQFSSTGPTSGAMGMATMAGLLSLSILLSFIHLFFFFIGLAMLLIFIAGYSGFYAFCAREKGIVFALKTFLASYFFSWVVGISACLSMIDAGIAKITGRKDYVFS
jgi:glycosyltransferase involved in cell wall biosynthesis